MFTMKKNINFCGSVMLNSSQIIRYAEVSTRSSKTYINKRYNQFKPRPNRGIGHAYIAEVYLVFLIHIPVIW